jgi:hypothetical protein
MKAIKGSIKVRKQGNAIRVYGSDGELAWVERTDKWHKSCGATKYRKYATAYAKRKGIKI